MEQTCDSLDCLFVYTGGNQRELARQKNAKKANEQSKGKRGDDGLSAAARKQRYGAVCLRCNKQI